MEKGLDVREHDAALAAVVCEVVGHALGHAERGHDVGDLLVDAHEPVARVHLALLADDHPVVPQTELDSGDEPARPGSQHEHVPARARAVDGLRKQPLSVLEQAVHRQVQVVERAVAG